MAWLDALVNGVLTATAPPGSHMFRANSLLLEMASVLVRFYHVANYIVNANQSAM